MEPSEKSSFPDSSRRSPSQSTNEPDLEQELAATEALLQQIKERYLQIRNATQQRQHLRQHLQELQAELKQVKEHLETLEIELESRLFSWSSQREVFWQFLRFAGLGFIGGLILKACTDS